MRPARANEHLLTGSYAIDAIENAAERARFERHARRCQDCADELRGLTHAATRLGIAAGEDPPAGLRDRILAAASDTTQLPAAASARHDHAMPAVLSTAGVRVPLAVRVARTAWLVAAACLIVVIGLAVALAATSSRLGVAQHDQAGITAVLNAPDARALARPTTAGGTATVVYSMVRHALIVTSDRLPAPRNGRVYELWLIRPSLISRAGLLPAASNGQGGPVLVRGLRRGDQLGLTVEPAGGTRQPTTKPILLVPLRE